MRWPSLALLVLCAACDALTVEGPSVEAVPMETICADTPDYHLCTDAGDDTGPDANTVDAGDLDASTSFVDVADARTEFDARIELDGASDSAPPILDASKDSATPPDAHIDSGPQCMCTTTMPVCVAATGDCLQCSAGNTTACGADKPHCGPASSCVACIEGAHCPAAAPSCSSNRCVGCSTTADCSFRNATPACNPSSGACVQCTTSTPGACGGATPVCDNTTNTCVACNVSADCKSATKPICENHACRACTQDADCSGQGKVCREDTGECVACTPDKDEPTRENCANGKACNPKTFACTGETRRSLSGCIACASDSECLSGTRCVPTNFKGAAHGSYCLLQQGSGICPAQYSIKRAAMSTIGVSADYCFPNDMFTTCEAIRDFRTACPANPAQCGDDALPNDALCMSGLCTYGCDSDRDCSGGVAGSCTGAPGALSCKTN